MRYALVACSPTETQKMPLLGALYFSPKHHSNEAKKGILLCNLLCFESFDISALIFIDTMCDIS